VRAIIWGIPTPNDLPAPASDGIEQGQPAPPVPPPVPPPPPQNDWIRIRNHLQNEWQSDRAGHRGHRRGHHRHLKGIRRNSEGRVIAGVCSGVSQATGIDITFVRLGFIFLGLVNGISVFFYVLAWLVVPLSSESTNIYSRAIKDRRGIRLAVATVPAFIVLQFVVSVLHIGYLGFFSWPVFIALALGILIWRNASDQERTWINSDVAPMLQSGGIHSGWKLIIRIGLGVALAVGGIITLVLGHASVAALRPVGGAILLMAAIVVVLGPWWLSLLRDLVQERQARALAEERANMAAHVHDSVLQTLALIQRSVEDPQNVIRLARAQERELRAWLFEGRPPGSPGEDATMLGEGISLLQRHVEADHGITVHVVLVGDCVLTDGSRALLSAAQEATVNAAKWSGEEEVSLYAEVELNAINLFVRDRGHGFDPTTVPDDRQGIAQSMKARMARYGGTVSIRSSPGNGAEVEFSLPLP
jgi:signal transduction histidine kinase